MGLHGLIQAWKLIVSERPDAKLRIAGDGPQRDELEGLVAELGLASTVSFLGRVSDEQLVELYQDSDVTVVPSTSFEGFGLVVLESLACGTPVIATRIGGLPEVLAGLDADLLIPPDDVGALADRLLRALDGGIPDQSTCRAYAEAFSWPRCAALTSRGAPRRHGKAQPHQRARKLTTMRVLFVDHTSKPSGGQLAMVRLAEALVGHAEVGLLAPNDGVVFERFSAIGPTFEWKLPSGLNSITGRNKPSPRAVLDVVAPLRAAAACIRAFRPDVVHTNSLKAAVLGGLAARGSRTPLVIHVRDRLHHDYMRLVQRVGMRAAVRLLADGVVANSFATAEAPSRRRASRAVIPSPCVIDIDTTPYSPTMSSSRPIRILLLTRVVRWKGIDVLLRAAAYVCRCGASPFEVKIAGAPLLDDDGYLDEMRRLAVDLQLSRIVSFTGHVDHVEPLLRWADILVHCSTIPEPFGQVVVEGMAAGLAVIASGAGGPLEVVEDGVTGLLVAPSDTAGLARALALLTNDHGLRIELGQRGKHAVGRYRSAVVAAEMRAFYVDVLR